MSGKVLVDRQCYALAETFLADVRPDLKIREDTMLLAVEIQLAIEDFLAIVERRPPRTVEQPLPTPPDDQLPGDAREAFAAYESKS